MYKNISLLKYKRWQRILIAAIFVSLSSQIEFNTSISGFIIALSPLLLPIFLYFNQDLNPIPLSLAISFASPIFRGIILFLTNSSKPVIFYIASDIIYFICYGLIYYILYWKNNNNSSISFFLTIAICDYFSNVLEVGILSNFAYTISLFNLLFSVALIRTSLACLITFVIHYFTLLLRQDIHEQQYYHFIWIAASVKSEVYFMKKNTAEIENVTKNAYLLNEVLQKNANVSQANTAYNIARDIHEIKHSYQDITQILGEYFDDQTNKPMKLSDILQIVIKHAQTIISQRHSNIAISYKNDAKLLIFSHYYLVTILSNLILNSIDALSTNKINGIIKIRITSKNKDVIISVTDNGIGMDTDTLSMIYHAGFSTKFNQKTGDIYRGIGLSNVKTIVEEEFHGNIVVDSKINIGTTFTVTLNKNRLVSEEFY